MPPAPIPQNEPARLAAMEAYGILSGLRDIWTDELTRVAATVAGCPISLVSLVSADRQWFKGCTGLDVPGTPRDQAFCAYAIHGTDPFIIPDATRDQRFVDNPLVTGEPDIRFYAGFPLVDPRGHGLGTLCVIDMEPRELSPTQVEALSGLARLALRQIVETRTVHDAVTRIESISRELADKNDQLEQFVYIASHDLKSPILTIQAFAERIGADIESGRTDRVTRFTSVVVEAADRMRNHIDDLLEFSKIGSVTEPPDPLDAEQVVRGLVKEMEPQISQAGARVAITGSLPHLRMKRVHLLQVFQNLIGNALAHAGCEDRQLVISVEGSTDNGRATLRVRDNGPGIAEQYREKVFGLFERIDASTEGTGVGLAIVHRVAEIYGGRAWVESADGQGASFSIELPAPDLKADAAPDARTESKSDPRAA